MKQHDIPQVKITKMLLSFVAIIVFIGCMNAQKAIGSGNKNPQSPILNPKSLPGNSLVFTPNKGQVVDMAGKPRPDVLYKSEGAGADIYLRKTGVSYVLSDIGKVMHEIEKQKEIIGGTEQYKQQLFRNAKVKLHRIDLDFADCNPNPEIETSAQTEGSTSFYYSHCTEGITNVNSYNLITLKNIYKNIDVTYFGGKEQGLKYDIVINPGGNPNDIKLKYSGTEGVEINPSAGSGEELIIKNSVGEIKEKLPKVYQNINGKIVDIKTEYRLEHLSNNDAIIYFSFSSFNSSFPLVIDPWVSYYGGNTYDGGTGVATDPAGNLIFCGHTTSTNFPATAGAFQMSFNGPTSFLNTKGDVFVVKMNSAGLRLWATYYGGTDNETSHCVTTDAGGNIYVTGETLSTDFPTGASAGNTVHQGTYGGGGTSSENWFKGDAFVIAFNTTGSRLWATYYGGTSDETGSGITTDGINIYLSGTTYSGNAIANGASFQASINSTGAGVASFCDAFAVRFSPNGSTVWGTYIGGTDKEKGSGIACDLAGNIYVAGGTASTNFPVSGGCYQLANGGGGGDAFVFKFSPAGTRLWATYYGGSYQTMFDLSVPVVTDGLNNVILGCTISGNVNVTNNDGSASPGAYQPLYGGGLFEGNIIKFNSGGTRQWGTYLGANSDEYVLSVATDAANNIYAYGEWEDKGPQNYPISTCAYQPVYGGNEDQYIAKYDPNGQQRCITYMGGSGEDDLDYGGGPKQITVNGNALYITGQTKGNYPVTPGAYQTTYGAIQDGTTANAFIAQLCINLCEGKNLIIAPSANAVTCPNAPVLFTPNVTNSCDTSGYKYKWTFTGGTPNISTATKPSVTYSTPGYYNVKLVVSTPCKKDSVTKTNFIIVNPCIINATAIGAVLCSANNCTNITAVGSNGTSPYTYSWNTGAVTSTINVCPPIGTTTYTVTVTDVNGNYAITTTSVTVNQSPVLRTSSYNITCTQSGQAYVDSVNGLSSIQGTAGQIIWNYQFNWSNNSQFYSQNGLAAGGYTVSVTDNNNGCVTTKVFNITGTNPVTATFTYPTVCKGVPVTFTNTGSTGTGITHSWYIGFPLTPQVSGSTADLTTTFLSAGTYSVQHTVSNGTCTNLVINNITVINCSAGPTVTATGSSVCPGTCATVSSTGAGGTSPYTYSWSNGATTQNINPCPVATTTYTVTIKDTGGNTSTSTAVVTVNPAVSVITSSTNITCNGGTNGSVTAAAAGGSPAFVYTWSNLVSGSQVSGLASATYTVTVIDSKGCTSTATTTIVSPQPLAGQFTKGIAGCPTCGCKQWILVNAAGGTSPYSYTWPDGYVNRYKNQLCPGTYTINIKDKNGCSTNVSLTAP